jgi:hypothetical protein
MLQLEAWRGHPSTACATLRLRLARAEREGTEAAITGEERAPRSGSEAPALTGTLTQVDLV